MCRVFVENCSCVDRSIESEARFRVFMCVRRARTHTFCAVRFSALPVVCLFLFTYQLHELF